jgi:hypothetical protein
MAKFFPGPQDIVLVVRAALRSYQHGIRGARLHASERG